MKSKLDKYIDACNIEYHIIVLDDYEEVINSPECGGMVEDNKIIEGMILNYRD